jgi:hypothetical protein
MPSGSQEHPTQQAQSGTWLLPDSSFSLHSTSCLTLDVECPTNVHVLKALFPEWHCWEVVEPLGGGA